VDSYGNTKTLVCIVERLGLDESTDTPPAAPEPGSQAAPVRRETPSATADLSRRPRDASQEEPGRIGVQAMSHQW
jgi:hypothetical protein